MSDSSPPRLAAATAILLLAFGGAIGWLFAGGARTDTETGVRTVLEGAQVLRAEGTDFPFTLRVAGPASVLVTLSEHCTSEATVTLGPLRTALRPDPVYEPEAEAEHTFKVRAGAGPTRIEFRSSGPYVLRIEPVPMAMGNDQEPVS